MKSENCRSIPYMTNSDFYEHLTNCLIYKKVVLILEYDLNIFDILIKYIIHLFVQNVLILDFLYFFQYLNFI